MHSFPATHWRLAAILLCFLASGKAAVSHSAEPAYDDSLTAQQRAALKELAGEWTEEVDAETSERYVAQIAFSKHPDSNALHHLGKLRRLRVLDLQLTYVEDADLVHLADLSRLESVKFGRAVSGTGLEHLRELTSLKTILLQGKQVTDDSLLHLKSFPKLETLGLVGTSVTDGGMDRIAPLSELRLLSLYLTPVSDAAIEKLPQFEHLGSLYLGGTNITDACIPHLKQCKNLRLVTLGSTKVSKAAIARLREELPDLIAVD